MCNGQHHHPNHDGAGSILSTVGGPSDAPPPDSLGAQTPDSARLLENVSADAALAAHRVNARETDPPRV